MSVHQAPAHSVTEGRVAVPLRQGGAQVESGTRRRRRRLRPLPWSWDSDSESDEQRSFRNVVPRTEGVSPETVPTRVAPQSLADDLRTTNRFAALRAPEEDFANESRSCYAQCPANVAEVAADFRRERGRHSWKHCDRRWTPRHRCHRRFCLHHLFHTHRWILMWTFRRLHWTGRVHHRPVWFRIFNMIQQWAWKLVGQCPNQTVPAL